MKLSPEILIFVSMVTSKVLATSSAWASSQSDRLAPLWHDELQQRVQQLATAHNDLFSLSLAELFTQNMGSTPHNKSQQTP